LTDSGEVISGDLLYSSDLFEQATIERLREDFQTLLRAMIADESQHIHQLPGDNIALADNVEPAQEAGASLKSIHEAPAGEMEIAIAGIWRELLEVEHVGRHDHFFELGVH